MHGRARPSFGMTPTYQEKIKNSTFFLNFQEWYDKLMSLPTKKAAFLKACDHQMTQRNRKLGNTRHFMHDQLAVAIAMRRQVATVTRHVYATVELSGHHTRGQVVLNWSEDWSGKMDQKPNVHVVTEIDSDLYEKLIYKGLED